MLISQISGGASIITSTNKRGQLLGSLQNEAYRREYAADIGTGLAFQIRLLRERRGWTQDELAQKTGKRQETISQWENPGYGRYTLNTLKELAAAFDVALIVRFAPFSELVNWMANLTPERLAPGSYDEERSRFAEAVPESTSDMGVVIKTNELPIVIDFYERLNGVMHQPLKFEPIVTEDFIVRVSTTGSVLARKVAI